MPQEFNSGWQRTEQQVQDAARWIGGGATSAWHWSGRQLGWAGSELAQGGRGLVGMVDHRIAPMVLGHYYDTKIPLGVFHRVTPAMLLDAIQHSPKHFPIPGDKNFDLGANVTLTFLGTPNPVVVEKIDVSDPNRASMLLRAQPNHFFGGTAEHIILRQSGDRLVYEVIGHGPRHELWDRNRMNYYFGKDAWPWLVRHRVLPLAKALEENGR